MPLPTPPPTPSPRGSAAAVALVPPEDPITPRSCDAALPYGTEIQATAALLGPDQRTVVLAADLNSYFRFPPTGHAYDLEKRRIQLFDLATQTVRDVGRGTSPIAWSPSGRYLAFYEPQGSGAQVQTDLIVFDLQSDRELSRLHSEPFGAGIGWEGDALLYQVASTLRRWTPDRDVAVLHVEGTPYMWPSADGLAVLLTTYPADFSRRARTQVVDLATQLTTELAGAWQADWAPVGHRLLVSYLDHSELRDEDGHVTTYPYPVHYWALHWASDGRRPLFLEPADTRHAITQGPSVNELSTIDRKPSGVRLANAIRQGQFVADGHLLVALNADGYSARTFRPYVCRLAAAESATPPLTTQTMYYGESDEPWAAAVAGELPARWRDLATSDLAPAGIHPISMEVVRPIPFNVLPAGCALRECGNGWTLAITIPFSERERAFARCFQTGDGTTFIPGYPARTTASSSCQAF